VSTLIGEISPTGMTGRPRRYLLLFDDFVVHTRSKGWRQEARITESGTDEGDVWDPSTLAPRDEASWILPMDSITSVLMQRRVQPWLALITLGVAVLLPSQGCLTIIHTSGMKYVSWFSSGGLGLHDRQTAPLFATAFGERFFFDEERYFGRWPPKAS
jgi:hypothetical protein